MQATTCFCGSHVQGSNIDHSMSCNRLSGSRSRRHDFWKEALSRVTVRASCSNRVEPGYNEVGVAAPGLAGARADIEARLPPPHGPALLDVSITHPRATTYVIGAAARRGSAAEKRDHVKLREHKKSNSPVVTNTGPILHPDICRDIQLYVASHWRPISTSSVR